MMPAPDLIRSLVLHGLIAALTGAAWIWSLTVCGQLERRLGAQIPAAGGMGALAIGILLLVGGWKLLLPIQYWLTALLLPIESAWFAVLILLTLAFWSGFTSAVGLSALRRPAATLPPATVFGYRRRR